jgi:hypothetical protein
MVENIVKDYPDIVTKQGQFGDFIVTKQGQFK